MIFTVFFAVFFVVFFVVFFATFSEIGSYVKCAFVGAQWPLDCLIAQKAPVFTGAFSYLYDPDFPVYAGSAF